MLYWNVVIAKMKSQLYFVTMSFNAFIRQSHSPIFSQRCKCGLTLFTFVVICKQSWSG